VLAFFVVVTYRFGAIGEFDLFGTDVSLMRERLQSPLSEAFPEYKLRRTWC